MDFLPNTYKFAKECLALKRLIYINMIVLKSWPIKSQRSLNKYLLYLCEVFTYRNTFLYAKVNVFECKLMYCTKLGINHGEKSGVITKNNIEYIYLL